MKRSIWAYLFDGLKVSKFIRLVKADMEGVVNAQYSTRLLQAVIKHKGELPKSLTAKHEAEITAVLTELSELPLSDIQRLVSEHLK